MTERKDFHDRPSPRLRRRLRRFAATGEATHRPAEFMFAQEFANQIANQLRNTPWHGASQNGMAAMKMPNQSAQLAMSANPRADIQSAGTRLTIAARHPMLLARASRGRRGRGALWWQARAAARRVGSPSCALR